MRRELHDRCFSERSVYRGGSLREEMARDRAGHYAYRIPKIVIPLETVVKIQRINLDLKNILFDHFWDPIWSSFGTFWDHFGPFWALLGPLWSLLGTLWRPFWSHWDHFGLSLVLRVAL